jgi:hypothetical protein
MYKDENIRNEIDLNINSVFEMLSSMSSVVVIMDMDKGKTWTGGKRVMVQNMSDDIAYVLTLKFMLMAIEIWEGTNKPFDGMSLTEIEASQIIRIAIKERKKWNSSK